MRERSLTRRIVVVTGLSVGIVLLAAAAVAVLLLKAHHERGFDARLRLDAQQLLSGLSRDKDGTLVIAALPDHGEYDERLSGWYWIIREADEVVARSRSLGARDVDPGLRSGAGMAGPQGERLRAVSLTRGGDAGAPRFEVTVAGPQSDVERALLSEIGVLIAGAGALGVALIAVLWWQVGRSLAPLREVAHRIEQLRDGRIETLPPSSYVELARLTTTINDLLKQSRDLVAGYRDRAAKLAHALKTPLAIIAARADAGGASPDPKVLDAVATMRRQIDHNLKRARAASGSSAFAQHVPVAAVVVDLMFALGHAYAGKALAHVEKVPPDLAFVGDREDLEEMLGNLIENAHKWARSRVSVSAARDGGHIAITVEDDGPGFPDSPMGTDGSAATDEDRETQHGLGIAIVREIAAGHGGSLALCNDRRTGGAVAVLRLPSAAV